jgi:hypothetical protein
MLTPMITERRRHLEPTGHDPFVDDLRVQPMRLAVTSAQGRTSRTNSPARASASAASGRNDQKI